MSDYGIKYQIAYYRFSGGKTTINILEKDFVESDPTDLVAAEDPLEISFEGDINNIYKPTLGSGAIINVMATPLTLQEFFTTDPQKFKVRIYNGDSEESSGADNLVWQGFVNTGIYNESYSTPLTLKSKISIYCNDGMSLFDNIDYYSTNQGFKTLSIIFNTLFYYLDLDFNNVRLCSNLEYDTHTNLFTALTTMHDNYYDEEGVIMTCREVMDSVLSSLGLVMFFIGDTVYIIDPIDLHNSDTVSKLYDFDPVFGRNESVEGFGGYLDISAADITWFKTGQRLDITQPFNYINVKYDPYNWISLEYDFNDVDNITTVGTFADLGGWFQNSTVVFSGWSFNALSRFIGIKETEDDDPIYGLFLGDSDDIIRYQNANFNINQDASLTVKVSCQAYANTKVVTANIYSAVTKCPLNAYYISYAIKIGNLYWKDDHWEAGESGNYKQLLVVRDFTISSSQYVADNSLSQVGDVWMEAFDEVTIANLGGANAGISIYVYDTFATMVGGTFLSLILKDFKVEFINPITGKVIENNGVNFNGVIDSSSDVKKASLDINLKQGIGAYGTSRGAFSSAEAATAGINITGLERAGGATQKTTELVLQSLLTQYGSPRFKLTGYLNVVNYISDVRLYLIKDTDHMGSKAFYIVSGTYHDREEYMEVVMSEIGDTRETIT